MKTYLVGGAVRDALLGLPVNDRDWVVVGATPQQMKEQGFLAVGRDFPVFLHPHSHDEYALARTERKTSPGYRGFVVHSEPGVTLEQDLARRDLTINSIALDGLPNVTSSEGGAKPSFIAIDPARLIDPFGGQRDLAHKLLRHTTDAFREDPVRILRVARFAARFPDFSIAPETQQLLLDMVNSGEADHLVAERVWAEISKGLMTDKPSRMFDVLRDCGALARLFPPIEWTISAALILDASARVNASLPVRFASLKPFRKDPSVLSAPTHCQSLASLAWREMAAVELAENLSAEELVSLLERCDAIRKPERFADLLKVCECEALAQAGMQGNAHPPSTRLLAVLLAAQSVSTPAIAALASDKGLAGPAVGAMIRAARVAAVTSLTQWISPE